MQRNSKATNVLFVIGCIFMIVGYYFSGEYLISLIEFMDVESGLSEGLSVALGVILLMVPASICSVVSFILHMIAYRKTVKPAGFARGAAFVLSILLPLFCASLFIATHLVTK